jgi:predicted TIM-barrel fold metal-dependent hydrolase
MTPLATQRRAFEVPVGACDCHMHVFDRRFAPSPHWRRTPPHAPVSAYRKLQKRLGIERAVIVNPSTYGTDNACMLDALAQMGSAARGIAVVGVDISDDELLAMARAGVVGIRVNFVSPQSWGATTLGMLETLAHRVAMLKWHVQVLMHGSQIVESRDVLTQMPTTLVIDHLGRISQAAGVADPAFAAILRLLDSGNVWVKLSGAYMDSVTGPPSYSDVGRVAQGFVRAAPERVVWGSDWPHTTETQPVDDAQLIDLLAEWSPDSKTRMGILVDNPCRLYGFT